MSYPFAATLSETKEGDYVIHHTHYYGKSVIKVDRTTKTMIVFDSNMKFRISDGYRVGDIGWHRDRIIAPKSDDELIRIIKENTIKEIRYELSSAKWNDISDYDVDEIYNLYVASKP